MKRLAMALVVVFVVVVLIGGVLLLQNERLTCRLFQWRCPPASLADLRARLTPEVRECIVHRLGWQEAQRAAEEIRATGRIDPDTWAQIAPCFETATPPTAAHVPSTSSPPTSQENSACVSLSFGYDQLPERAFQLAAEAGIGWVRAVLNWNLVEPAPGQYDWSTFDRIIGYARSHGLKMIGGLGYTTSWNTTAPPEETNQGRRLMYPPADLETWKRYVTNTVSRYKDVVRAWEVWNEPDLQAFWVGTPAQYAQLLAVTYETVKRVDPTAMVLLGGLSLGGAPGRLNPTFLEDILADPNYPAAQYFDVAVFHHYGPRSEAQRRMEYVKSALARAAATFKEIWITESGYTGNPAAQDLPQYQGGPEAQARWLEDTLPYLFQLGAARVCWFQLMDNLRQAPRAAAMGLLDPSAQPKPAYFTYRDLIRTSKLNNARGTGP